MRSIRLSTVLGKSLVLLNLVPANKSILKVYNIPLLAFLDYHALIDVDLFVLSFSECSRLACGRKHPLWLRIVGFDSVTLLLHPIHVTKYSKSKHRDVRDV